MSLLTYLQNYVYPVSNATTKQENDSKGPTGPWSRVRRVALACLATGTMCAGYAYFSGDLRAAHTILSITKAITAAGTASYKLQLTAQAFVVVTGYQLCAAALAISGLVAGVFLWIKPAATKELPPTSPAATATSAATTELQSSTSAVETSPFALYVQNALESIDTYYSTPGETAWDGLNEANAQWVEHNQAIREDTNFQALTSKEKARFYLHVVFPYETDQGTAIFTEHLNDYRGFVKEYIQLSESKNYDDRSWKEFEIAYEIWSKPSFRKIIMENLCKEDNEYMNFLYYIVYPFSNNFYAEVIGQSANRAEEISQFLVGHPDVIAEYVEYEVRQIAAYQEEKSECIASLAKNITAATLVMTKTSPEKSQINESVLKIHSLFVDLHENKNLLAVFYDTLKAAFADSRPYTSISDGNLAIQITYGDKLMDVFLNTLTEYLKTCIQKRGYINETEQQEYLDFLQDTGLIQPPKRTNPQRARLAKSQSALLETVNEIHIQITPTNIPKLFTPYKTPVRLTRTPNKTSNLPTRTLNFDSLNS